MPPLVRILAVKHLHDYVVLLSFTDGSQKEVDLECFLHGPIFRPLRDDPCAFAAVKVDARLGTIVWDNGADIDPDVLYHDLKPEWMSQEQRSSN